MSELLKTRQRVLVAEELVATLARIPGNKLLKALLKRVKQNLAVKVRFAQHLDLPASFASRKSLKRPIAYKVS